MIPKKLIKRIALATGILLLAAIVFVLWSIRDLPTPAAFAERHIEQTTQVFDRTGNVLLFEFFNEQRRRVVALDEISPYLVNATLAAEDDQFFHHIGIDIPGVIRSTLRDIFKGEFAEGGSTITQQLVRNAVLTPEKTPARKIREIVLSLELELRYSKEEILEAYLNQIPYGSNIYGSEAASRMFFNKPVSDLTLDEAAALAALPKAPSFYSPYGSHAEELIARRNHILDRMEELGYISHDEGTKAREQETMFAPLRTNIKAPHFVFFAREEAERLVGTELLERGGLRITTSLDWKLQEIAEKNITDLRPRIERWGATNAALVAIDPKSGEILALVGSVDYFDDAIDGKVNVAIRQRQPGSSFKPVVYAAALERGFTTETVLFDVPTEFATGGAKSYRPQNYNGSFMGPITARQALANSLNVPSVKMLYLAGVENAIKLAERLGVTTLTRPDEYGLALVLGGGAVTLLEETGAFGVFANDGIRVPSGAILKIEDAQGKILYERKAEEKEALDKEIARQITNILSDNNARAPIFGTNSPLTLGSRPVAAKTGTHQDFRDAWTVGYTPSLVTGVWVGNTDNSPMKQGADGVVIAAPIWNRFMKSALEHASKEEFVPPKPVSTDKPILNGQWAIEETVFVDRASGKKATERTPPEWTEKRVYRVVHDTLFWINRSDPRGDPPDNPYQDPQFANWEQAVQKWISSDPTLAQSAQEHPH